MVHGRSVVAGVLGIVFAIAVLGFMSLSQFGLTLTPSMNFGANPSAAIVTSTQGQSNQSAFTASSSSIFPYGAIAPGPRSSQSIESPNAVFGAALLGVISLVVGLAAAFVVSRRA
jgi:hypothetical protein